MMKGKLLITVLIVGILGFAQDISGLWLVNEFPKEGEYSMLYLKVDDKGKLTGMSHDIESGGFCFYKISGKYNAKRQKITISADSIIDKTTNHKGTTLKLKYAKIEHQEFIKGKIKIPSALGIVSDKMLAGIVGKGKKIIIDDSKNLNSTERKVDYKKSIFDELLDKPMYKDIITYLYDTGFISKDSAEYYLSKKYKIEKKIKTKKTLIARHKSNSRKIILEFVDKGSNNIDVYLNKNLIQKNLELNDSIKKLEIKLPSNQEKNRIIFRNSNQEQETSNSVILKYSFDDKEYETTLEMEKGEDNYLEFKSEIAKPVE